MRSIWSGSISFGLVNIPVKLYSATGGDELNFDMLHKKDFSPIRYAKMCKLENKEIPYEEIVKGFEYRKGEYVVISDEDFKKANVKKTKSIEIISFSDEGDIHSIFYEKPYFLEPDKGAEKSYALLRSALSASKKVGVSKFVIRNREHLGVLKPVGNVVILDQLRFFEEVRDPKELNLPDEQIISEKEVDLALALINQLTEGFDPKEHKDTYVMELKRVIEEKSKGIVPVSKGTEPVPTPVPDLMQTLRASLEREQQRMHH